MTMGHVPSNSGLRMYERDGEEGRERECRVIKTVVDSDEGTFCGQGPRASYEVVSGSMVCWFLCPWAE